MTENQAIRWDRDSDGVVTLTFDSQGKSANTMDGAYVEAMAATLDRLEAERDEIAGVILASAKKTFFAGGDLDELLAVERADVPAFADHVRTIKAQLRRLETLGRPVVAALGGAALGGGLEIALAAHRRIAVDSPATRLGFPEVTLGLLPGAGGVVRSVRLLGVVPALRELLLEGRARSARDAAELGIVDELVADADELVPAAKAWIASGPDGSQPWDRDGYSLPGGDLQALAAGGVLATLPAKLGERLGGARYPAPHHVLAAAVEGAQVDFDGALEIEGRYFVDLVTSQTAKRMIRALFFDMREVRERMRPADAEPYSARRAAVLGAGMMGSGIAYVCAKAGIEVVLIDADPDAARRGREHSERLVARAVAAGRTDERSGQELVERIEATTDPAAASGADLLIEAVFEDPAVKAEALAAVEPHLAPDALLASNTSTLPIHTLAAHTGRPDAFIGLHFFSPVDRMELLEIVEGEQTSPETVARALAVARQLGKTAVVVADRRGFFTSHVIQRFIDEGIAMVGEGVPAPSIEQASRHAGYPAAVLQLADELGLSLMRDIREAARADAGESWTPGPADAVIDRMLDELGRGGRAGGGGFYDYVDGRRTGLWPGLAEAFAASHTGAPPQEDLSERMLFAEALAAVERLETGVVSSAADANVASILGIGFPRWTGGVLRYVETYPGGPTGFAARAHELAERYGSRFEPPAALVELAERGRLSAGTSPAGTR